MSKKKVILLITGIITSFISIATQIYGSYDTSHQFTCILASTIIMLLALVQVSYVAYAKD